MQPLRQFQALANNHHHMIPLMSLVEAVITWNDMRLDILPQFSIHLHHRPVSCFALQRYSKYSQ